MTSVPPHVTTLPPPHTSESPLSDAASSEALLHAVAEAARRARSVARIVMGVEIASHVPGPPARNDERNRPKCNRGRRHATAPAVAPLTDTRVSLEAHILLPNDVEALAQAG